MSSIVVTILKSVPQSGLLRRHPKMATVKSGYHCSFCGPVNGKIYWSKEHQELVVDCVKCGVRIQTHDTSMYTTTLLKENN